MSKVKTKKVGERVLGNIERKTKQLGFNLDRKKILTLPPAQVYALHFALKHYDEFKEIKKVGDVKRLAEKLGVSYDTVEKARSALLKLGCVKPLKHKHSDITDDIIHEVMKMINEYGISLKQIAKKLDINYGTLLHALWKRGIKVRKCNDLKEVLKKHGPMRKGELLTYISPKRLPSELEKYKDIRQVKIMDSTYYYLPEQYDNIVTILCSKFSKIKRVKKITRNGGIVYSYLKYRISDIRLARDVANCIEHLYLY